ncbi:oligosaccharide flippase family protein [Candidatus Daviesbacteria bacterium]|nr:oligosaccharide flippase family protein [Candidatus Daviesbacteria bacterium]
MPNLLKISQQTLWQVLGKVVTSLSTFIILGLVARNYGEEGTGIFTLALTYLAIFYLLGDFGFNAHVLRRVKSLELRVKAEWQKLLGTRIIWSVVLIFVAVGLLPFWPFATAPFSQAVLFGSLAIMASAIFVTCNLIFQSKLRYDLSVLASSFGTIFGLGIFAYLIFLQLPIPLLLLAHLLSWLMIALVALFLIYKLAKTALPIYDIPYTKHLFKASWPIATTLALNVVYFRADAFILAYFKSGSEVGIYNLAFSVFQTALVLPTFIMNAYYPLMLKSLRGIKLVGLGLLGLSSAGTILTFIFSPTIIQILTGGGFSGSTISLQILSLGFPAYFLSALIMWILVTRGQYQQMLLVYGLGLVINLSLNFIYIPKYSFYAASWITVISEYLILFLQAFILIRNK